MDVLEKIRNHICKVLTSCVYACNRCRLSNHQFSIIANNCIGGIIYHDLKEQFRTPMINLDISPEQFVVFCEHLDYYLSRPIDEIESDTNCPVGVIRGDYGDVRINFRHYKTFNEGLAKWNERLKRLNFDDLYIIMEAPFAEDDVFIRFDALPFVHKACIAPRKGKNIMEMPYDFYYSGYGWGKILEKTPVGIYRYMDRWDYVRFLNSGRIKKRILFK